MALDFGSWQSAWKEALDAFDRPTVPFELIYLAGRKAPVILPELHTPTIVLDAKRSR
jgi:hypothetical protein